MTIGRRSSVSSIAIRALLLCAILAIAIPGARPQTFQENALIANYLVGFAEFTHWETNDNTLVIAIFDADGVAEELNKLPPEDLPPGLTLKVQPWTPTQPLENVDILYLSKSRGLDLSAIIHRAQSASALTVSNDENFLSRGGLIQFIHSRNRLRFAVNNNAAAGYKLQFSSKLVGISVALPQDQTNP